MKYRCNRIWNCFRSRPRRRSAAKRLRGWNNRRNGENKIGPSDYYRIFHPTIGRGRFFPLGQHVRKFSIIYWLIQARWIVFIILMCMEYSYLLFNISFCLILNNHCYHILFSKFGNTSHANLFLILILILIFVLCFYSLFTLYLYMYYCHFKLPNILNILFAPSHKKNFIYIPFLFFFLEKLFMTAITH